MSTSLRFFSKALAYEHSNNWIRANVRDICSMHSKKILIIETKPLTAP